MKKRLTNLVFGTLLALAPETRSYGADANFNIFLASFKDCAHAAYGYQKNPGKANRTRQNAKCSKTAQLVQEQQIENLKEYFHQNGFYYTEDDIKINGRNGKSYFAAPIVEEKAYGNTKVYIARPDENSIHTYGNYLYGGSFGGGTSFYSDGSSEVVVDKKDKEESCKKIDLEDLKSNEEECEEGGICNISLYAVSKSLDYSKKRAKARFVSECVREDLESTIKHELGHVQYGLASGHLDEGSEIFASAEGVKYSPIALGPIYKSKNFQGTNDGSSHYKRVATKFLNCMGDVRSLLQRGREAVARQADYCQYKLTGRRGRD